MDTFQHVHNIEYFRHLESARILHSEMLGLRELEGRYRHKTDPRLHKHKYKFPLTYPDTVLIGAMTVGIEDDRFSMKYVVVSRRHNRIASEGDDVVVMYNYNEGKKTAITEEIRKRIAELEKI